MAKLLVPQCGSISEQITLDTLGSGDERKAEPICRQIYSVFSSQFGQAVIAPSYTSLIDRTCRKAQILKTLF